MSTKTESRGSSSAAQRAAAQRAAREAAARAKRRKKVLWGVVAVVALALIGVAGVLLSKIGSGGAEPSTASSVTVGGDLHTVSDVKGRLYVAGHQAAGVSSDGGKTWRSIPSLTNADPMGWAVTSDAILVGGHPGMFRSIDGGETFEQVALDFADVHALGGASGVLYAGSAERGILASTDGGATWEPRNTTVGQSFMGTMLVDPNNPDRIVAPDMSGALTTSTDGGRTWTPLGGPMGAMSATWNPTDTREILAVGMNGGAISTDGGASWQEVALPAGTTAASYAEDGRTIYAGVLNGVQATTYRSTNGGATWSPTS